MLQETSARGTEGNCKSLLRTAAWAMKVRAWQRSGAGKVNLDETLEGLECQTKELRFDPKGMGGKRRQEGTFNIPSSTRCLSEGYK